VKIGLTSIQFNKQGGISRYVVELAQRLVGEHEVHVLTSDYEYKVEGVHPHEGRILWKPVSMQVASNALLNVGRINRLRGEGVELVNSQGAEALNSDVVTMQSCQKAAVTQLTRERGPGYGFLKAFEPRNRVVLAVEKRVLNASKRVIAISRSVKDEVVGNYGIPEEKVRVVYSGVNVDEFTPANRERYRETVRARHGIAPDDRVLMFSGWEFKRKGLAHAIEALPALKNDVKLLVVGGADRGPYASLASRLGVLHRVVFAGHSRNIAEYYAASDIFVFPTAYEPFGLVITEAMASGLPVVVTGTAGAAELITDEIDGMLLSTPCSGREVAEKVGRILDGDLLDRMGRKARGTAERYTWDRVAKETLEVYREALG
jgi:UDP-glucose:(heptosyl)LPS alpha-1,3-glucosyltransferase